MSAHSSTLLPGDCARAMRMDSPADPKNLNVSVSPAVPMSHRMVSPYEIDMFTGSGVQGVPSACVCADLGRPRHRSSATQHTQPLAIFTDSDTA